jgi:hypothetical protein
MRAVSAGHHNGQWEEVAAGPPGASASAPVHHRLPDLPLGSRDLEELCDELDRAEPLGATEVDWFVKQGVNPQALSRGRDGVHDPVRLDEVIFHPHAGFEFLRYAKGRGEPVRATIIMALTPSHEPLDLIAWSNKTAQIAAWRNLATLLGEENLIAPRTNASGGLVIHRTPLGYLKSRRRGIVIVMPRYAARRLIDHGPFEAEDDQHRRQLRKVLTMPAPVIRLPGDAIRSPLGRDR